MVRRSGNSGVSMVRMGLLGITRSSGIFLSRVRQPVIVLSLAGSAMNGCCGAMFRPWPAFQLVHGTVLLFAIIYGEEQVGLELHVSSAVQVLTPRLRARAGQPADLAEESASRTGDRSRAAQGGRLRPERQRGRRTSAVRRHPETRRERGQVTADRARGGGALPLRVRASGGRRSSSAGSDLTCPELN